MRRYTELALIVSTVRGRREALNQHGGTMTAAPLLTVADLVALPDDARYELSRGVLIRRDFAPYGLGLIAGRMVAAVAQFAKARGLGDCGSAGAGFQLASDPDTVRAPSAWFVRAVWAPSKDAPDGFFAGPPDLAIELFSHSDRFQVVMAKVRDYLEAGTPLLWAIDPTSETAAVYRLGQSVRFLDEGDALDGDDVLPGFTLALRGLLA